MENNHPSFEESLPFVLKHVRTAFLFTKSDIKTTLIPVTFFAVAAAPMRDVTRLPHTMLWIWIHLLQFDVSNQTMDPEEDMLNKGDRPLPSKRITLRNAIILRWALVPVCWILSAFYSRQTLCASISLILLTVVYNELSAHSSNWVNRNVVNAAGFASFETGATLIAGDCSNLANVSILSIFISAGIFATTIHAQDFKDEVGDRLIGRQTIPIVYPSIARYTVLLPLTIWSLGLAHLWGLDFLTGCLFNLLAVFVGYRFLVSRTVHDDQVAFYWYNVWLSMAHALPGYYFLFNKF